MLIRRELPADTDLLALHRADPARFPLLLESVAGAAIPSGALDDARPGEAKAQSVKRIASAP